jgi:flagellar biosynthesis protein FlhG
VPPETHHDLLEVDRGATEEEIRRAFKRAKDVYASDALCCYGLFAEPGLEALRARLDEAYDVLLDPARRRPYELSVFPPEPAPAAPDPDESDRSQPAPPPPVITPETEFTGGLLRAVRESQRAALRDISHRTKIGQAYLRAIEEDDFAKLPPAVYVRGFVTELAKCLRLDPDQVARTYTRRYRRYLEEQGHE